VLIAIGNSGDAGLAASARHSLEDPSALVRGAAVWALQRLLAEADFSTLSRQHLPREVDDGVRAEWQA
jgi:epoxyqueuosine reductase